MKTKVEKKHGHIDKQFKQCHLLAKIRTYARDATQKLPKNTKTKTKKGPKSTKMFGNVPESTKMYQEGPKNAKKYQKYVKVREEIPKATKSTKKFKNI